MKYVKLPEEVVKALLQYLATRPYAEVHQGIEAIQQAEVVEEKEE